MDKEKEPTLELNLGLDLGVFSAKGALIDKGHIKTIKFPTAGRPIEAAQKCIDYLLEGKEASHIKVGVMGQNGQLLSATIGIDHLLEIEALQAGLVYRQIKADYVL